MSNTMINSFKQALEEKQKNLSSSELSINNDKRLIKIFSDSLKYLAISLKNSYEINIIDISFFNKKINTQIIFINLRIIQIVTF